MLQAVRDNIIVKYVEPTVPKGSLIMPTTQQDHNVGEVVNIGPGVYEYGVLRPVSVQVGFQVLYSKFAGTKIVDNNTTYTILKDHEILAYKAPNPIPPQPTPTPVQNN